MSFIQSQNFERFWGCECYFSSEKKLIIGGTRSFFDIFKVSVIRTETSLWWLDLSFLFCDNISKSSVWSLKSDSHLPKIFFICHNESPLKIMKNAFYFILKPLFVLKIFKFLPWHRCQKLSQTTECAFKYCFNDVLLGLLIELFDVLKQHPKKGQ